MAEQEDNGLTLQGLANRLEALERENERIRSENAELWGEVSALRGSGTHREEVVTLRGSETPREWEVPATALGGRVSRRSLLSKAGAAAVGTVVAAGMLLDTRRAKANHIYGPNATIDANEVRTHRLIAENQGTGGTVAVYGLSMETQGSGVWGRSRATHRSGVRGTHEGLVGFGVLGEGGGQDGAGVLGKNDAGYGVVGRSSAGYGGRFEGGKAQLLLIPDGKAGKPTTGTHNKGELYMDSQAALFVCTADGSPGTWTQVATNPASNAAGQSRPSDQLPSHGGVAGPPLR